MGDGGGSIMYGAARCANLNGGCQGASDTHCRPNTLWLYNLRSTGNYEHAWLNNGTLNTLNGADTAFTHAYSVRCVLDSTYVLLEKQRKILGYRLVCSFATNGRVLSTALHSVTRGMMAAARALLTVLIGLPTATRTSYGQVTYIMAVLSAIPATWVQGLGTTTPVRIPRLTLCAVPWT